MDSRQSVLVTGALGTIGPRVVRELVRRGQPVVAFDQAVDPVIPFPEIRLATIVRGDVRDDALADRILRDHRVARIVHLAAIVGTTEPEPALAIEVKALATVRLLDSAAERGVWRVVALSTKGVLGPLERRHVHPRYEPVPAGIVS